MYVLMLTSRNIAPCFLSSFLGALMLCLLLGLGFAKAATTGLEAGVYAQTMVAEEAPGAEGFTTLFCAAGESAVLQVSGAHPFLKANRLSFRGLHLSALPATFISRSHSFCRAFAFFRILPNAP